MVNYDSEVDLTKQCYQIWQKVAKVLPEMAKSHQSGKKSAKVEKKGSTGFQENFYVFKLYEPEGA